MNDFIILEFSENFAVLKSFWSGLGVFGEYWRSRDRLIDMYWMYRFKYGCIYRYTVSICNYEVFTMWSAWRFRGISGGFETLSET